MQGKKTTKSREEKSRGRKLNEHIIGILNLFRSQKTPQLFLPWSFIQMFPQGFQKRSVEEKIAQGRIAGKYSRKEKMSGYRKLAE